jgi:hypothetical protein
MPKTEFKTIITNVEALKMAKPATAKEKKHLSKVASMGCIVCVNLELGETDAEIHHIGNGTMGKRADNYQTIPLCHIHHRTGGYGVAVHQGRVQWESNFGTEQELLLQTLMWVDL